MKGNDHFPVPALLRHLRLNPASRERPQAVLFDWDDTLFHLTPFSDTLAQKLLDKWAPDAGITPQQLNREWRMNSPAALAKYFPGMTVEGIVKEWETLYDNHYHDKALLPDAEAVLDGLRKKGIRIGIVSNKSREVVMREVEHFGLGGYFEVVVGKDTDRRKMKPSPDPIIKAIQAMNCSLENVWFVGDSVEDMQAARTCGIQRFHIHHDDERRDLVKFHGEHNDPANRIIYLNNLREFHRFISRIPDAQRKL